MNFHKATEQWFTNTFGKPTTAQANAWPSIQGGNATLLAAPTGSGKTLAAFLAAIDELVEKGLQGELEDQTYVLYVSPLKALSNDIEKNLQIPIQGIDDQLNEMGQAAVNIRSWVRTGDTPASERSKMSKTPPHIVVTTPESLFILLSSDSGRNMLRTTRTVIIDEVHALANNKRGAHLTLSLERLEALTGYPITRIGLSATQKPIELMAQFLVGNNDKPCNIIDSGYTRERDIKIEVTGAPLEAIMSNEVWEEVYNRLSELILSHRTTLIFVNTRRLAERASRFLAERIGEQYVSAHHGSLAREHRLAAEQKLKRGELKAMVATASLELGIDIGEIDLVCQIGSPRRIASLLQRVGRSGHFVGGIPKGRLFPSSRDDLCECTALLAAIDKGELDALNIPDAPLDALAQQIIAEVACQEWDETELFSLIKKAYPYRRLDQDTYEQVLNMLADGFSTRRGRRSAYIHRDEVNKKLRARKGARLTAVTNAGTIPDQFDYDVILEPQGQFIGTLNEDFAFESLPGDIFQLGNISYRILKIEQGKVRVEDAHGQPPNIPFWFGEAPGRSDELSMAVSELRSDIEQQLKQGMDQTIEQLVQTQKLPGQAAVQLVEYLAATHAAIGTLPTQEKIIFERFFDEAGDQHLVIHSTYGSRLNRAWGLALRKRFCRKFNFELQAAALEDTIVLSLGATHSFPLEEVATYLNSTTVRDVLIQAMLDAPMFLTHWRWNACVALAIKRNRNGKRVPAQFQRMDAEDLIAVIFPDQLACLENIAGAREIPEHPLVKQTIDDCLHELMDIRGLEKLLAKIENNTVEIICKDMAGPSPLAQEILHARPYAFLDDAPAEERRTQAVAARRFSDPQSAADLGRLSPDAIRQVCEEAWPKASTSDELHDAILMLSFATQSEASDIGPQALFEQLINEKRITLFTGNNQSYWITAERLTLFQTLFPKGTIQNPITAVGRYTETPLNAEDSLIEILRGRLQGLGPIDEASLANSLGLEQTNIQHALQHLEQEGFCMRGQYSEAAVTQSLTQWCERGLLARIHRYTVKKLRQEVQPVSAAAYMRFLFRWHHLDEKRNTGGNSLAGILKQLEGFAISAAAWESDIIPSRIKLYSNSDLDQLCLSGQLIWRRLTKSNTTQASKKKTSGSPVRNTPILLLPREHQHCWLQNHSDTCATLSSPANKIKTLLQDKGASFFIDLVKQSGLLRTQVETALGELVSNGLVSSDSFSGLRALTAPSHKKPSFTRHKRRLKKQYQSIDNAGRWSLLNQQKDSKKESVQWLKTNPEVLEHVAMTLLNRYGVIFRKLLEREHNLPAWRELLYCYRRLEARGEIRGGRFVEGFAGEQFALPEAIGLLRKADKTNDQNTLIALSAADPLNLTGIITPGQRVPAIASNRVLYKDGQPVALHIAGKIQFLLNLEAKDQWTIQNKLLQQQRPANYFHAPSDLN